MRCDFNFNFAEGSPPCFFVFSFPGDSWHEEVGPPDSTAAQVREWPAARERRELSGPELSGRNNALCPAVFFFRFFGDGIQSESGKMITKWTDVCVFTFSRVLPPSLNSAQVELDEASSTHKGPYFFFRGYKKSRAAFTCQRCALSVQPALKTCVILVLKNEICLSLPGPCRMWNPALQCLNVWDFFKAINVKRKHPFFPLTEREGSCSLSQHVCAGGAASEPHSSARGHDVALCRPPPPFQQSAAETAGPAFCWKPGKKAPLLTPAVSTHSFFKT